MEYNAVKKVSSGFIGAAYSVAVALLFFLLLRTIAVQITPPPPLETSPYPDVSTEELCKSEGGRWVKNNTAYPGEKPAPVLEDGRKLTVEPYCQGPLRFELERRAQEDKSRQTSLFVFAIGGSLAVAASALLRHMRVLPIGLILGGIVAFITAGVNLWQLSAAFVRLVTMVVLFALVLAAGWYAFREKENLKQ